MIGILCPLKQEAEILIQSDTICTEEKQEWGSVWRSKDNTFCIGIMGVGEKIACSRTEIFLKNLPITIAIEFGLAGALIDGIKVGDIVIADEVIKTGHAGEKIKWVPHCIDELANHITSHPVIAGKILTTENVIDKKAKRDMLAHEYKAIAVTMESYGFITTCKKLGIPAYSIRTISDLAIASINMDYIATTLSLFKKNKDAFWEIIHYINKLHC